MIDLKLTEIFGVLGVGIFVVISIVYFFFLVRKLFNIRRHNKDAFITWLRQTLNGDYKDTGYAIITGLLVYCAGLLTQDITDHMTDSERNFNPLISFVKQTNLIENEGDLRMAVLIEDDQKLTGLGREIFGNARKILQMDSARRLPFFDNGQTASDYWRDNGKAVIQNKKELIGLINGLYYTSKNWCYMEKSSVQKELEDIQERVDFSRSIAIVAFLAILAICLLYVAYYFNECFIKKRRSRFKVVSVTLKSPEGEEKKLKRKIERRVFNPLRAVIILVIICYVAKICYSAAEKNFNERAMGYYVSHLKFQDEPKNK